jgi:hypothetical protein
MSHAQIKDALKHIFEGIRMLRETFPHRQFTIDGRLVGDIGEVVAEREYDMEIDEISQEAHDGTSSDGRRVQVKATFKDSLTFKTVPDYYLGLKFYEDGTFEEIFNGPGSVIAAAFGHRTGFGKQLLSFPNNRLRELSASVPDEQRIPKRVMEALEELA